MHKPCLLQHIAFIIKNGGGTDFIKDRYEDLKKFISFYKNNAYHEPTGLYFWGDDIAIGVDNDPAIFYRPDGSIASIYLNCLTYKELLVLKGYPEDYIPDDIDIPEEAKVRMVDNAPDVNMYMHILLLCYLCFCWIDS